MIDVIIPAYNCNATLSRTLSSLVAQIDKNFKVIIVDDCSTEDMKPIIEQYNTLLNIKYIRNEKNMRCGMSRQVGIDNSESEYFTFLDSDDVFMPYTISVFYQNIKTFPEVNVFNSWFYKTTDESNELFLVKEGFTWCHGRLYKREFVKKYNIKNRPDVKYADDSFFNSMCDELNEIGFMIIQVPMMIWMYNENSVTRKVDGEYKEDAYSDFISAMCKSIRFLKQYKEVSQIKFIKGTVKLITEKFPHQYQIASEAEKKRMALALKDLKDLLKGVNLDDGLEKEKRR